MDWFFKSAGKKAKPKDAETLRTSLLILLKDLAGELPRVDARQVYALIERLQTYPVPTGLERQIEKVVKALRATAVGVGSGDFADAATAMVDAMQRVSINDAELTAAINDLRDKVPARVRNSDARHLELAAQELKESADDARFKLRAADEAIIELLAAVQQQVGDALTTTTAVDEQLKVVLLRLADADSPEVLFEVRAEFLSMLTTAKGATSGARMQMERASSRVRELDIRVRHRGGDVPATGPQKTVDTLTRLADRGAFIEALPLALVEARRTNGMLTLMLLNLDGLGVVNSEYTRSSGDDVLRAVAHAVGKHLRNEDFVSRIEGDTFAALLPHAGAREATNAATRLSDSVRRMVFTHEEEGFSITVSIGIATWDGNESGDSLFARSERALKQAKTNGRDRYWVAKTVQG